MSGRTDAGVHAWGQVVTFDAPDRTADPDADRAHRHVAPRSGDRRPQVFGGRRTLRGPLLGHRAAVPLHRVQRAGARPVPRSDLLVGARAARPRRHATGLRSAHRRARLRLVLSASEAGRRCRRLAGASGERRSLGRPRGGVVRFEITGPAFCHQMVRSIVGTLSTVGRGRRSAGELLGVLAARDRNAAENLAPPHGLCLWEVRYEQPGVGWST